MKQPINASELVALDNVSVRTIAMNCCFSLVGFNHQVGTFSMHQPIESAILAMHHKCIGRCINFTCTEHFDRAIIYVSDLNC